MDDQDVDELVALADERLRDADAALADDYPGDRGTWQPVHTVYVPADRFSEHTHREYGDAALGLLERNEELFREVTRVDDATLALVRDKLQRRPVEDLRVDFEDGYGARADADEDADARAAAAALSRALADVDAPGRIGIRFKSLEAPTRRRGLRTLTLVLDGLSDLLGDADVVVTLPKVTSVEQVETLVAVLEQLEAKLVQGVGAQSFEIQVETPQTILGPDGSALVARMIRAAGPRLTGLHYGTYDYSAFLGIAAADQSLEHPAADHAKAVMQAAAAGTGVSSLRRLHQPAAGRRPAAERAGSCTTDSSRAPCTGASTRAGTCTPPSCRPGSPRPSSSSGPVPPTRRPGWRRTTRAGPAPSPTSRRPCAPWPTSSSGASSAGPSPTTRSRSRGTGSGPGAPPGREGG